jgi:hypothetical protein
LLPLAYEKMVEAVGRHQIRDRTERLDLANELGYCCHRRVQEESGSRESHHGHARSNLHPEEAEGRISDPKIGVKLLHQDALLCWLCCQPPVGRRDELYMAVSGPAALEADPGGFVKRRGEARERPSIRADGDASDTRACVRLMRG